MRISIVANPIAGGGKGRIRAEALRAALASRGHETELLVTQAAGDARRFAEERAGAGLDCIVSVGGDGTANEVVNGLGDSTTPYTVLPVGTANVVARQFGIPAKPAAVAEMLERNRVQEMDLGMARGEKFLLGAGAGLDAAITAKVKSRRGRTSSMWIWVRPSIETILSYRYPKIRVTVDGKVVSEDAHYAIVGNCIYSAGLFPSTPHASTDDGLLDVCLIHDITPVKCMSLACHVWSPSFTRRRDVLYCQGRDVRFEAEDEAAPLQIDGDPAGHVPVAFSLLPKAARIITP
jgi:diacylglycerol kinase (ATP)